MFFSKKAHIASHQISLSIFFKEQLAVAYYHHKPASRKIAGWRIPQTCGTTECYYTIETLVSEFLLTNSLNLSTVTGWLFIIE